MRLRNGVIFQNRNEDSYSSDEFIKELEEYIEPSDELTAVILEHDQLKAISNSTLWYGFYGLNVKLFLEEWRDKLNELKKYRKEQYTGKYIDGKTITISRSYGDHRFTDKEIQDLYEGKTITISFNTLYGNKKEVTGKLDKKDWPENEIVFWGFITNSIEEKENTIVEGIYQGKVIKFKNKFADHLFTESEIQSLLDGDSIYIKITNKNGKEVAVRLKLVPYQNDYYKANADFNVPPVFWAGKSFSLHEIEMLHLGHSLEAHLVSTTGEMYSAEIRWKDGKFERKTKDGWK